MTHPLAGQPAPPTVSPTSRRCSPPTATRPTPPTRRSASPSAPAATAAARARRQLQRGAHPRHRPGGGGIPCQAGIAGRSSSAWTPMHCRRRRSAPSRCWPPTASPSVSRRRRFHADAGHPHAILTTTPGGRRTWPTASSSPSAQSAAGWRHQYNPPHGGPADTDVTGWIRAPRQRPARRRQPRVRGSPARPRWWRRRRVRST